MRPFDYYLEHADDLAQDVVNAWGVNVSAGNAKLLTADFNAVFELACRFRTARETADNRRQFNMPGERDSVVENETLEAFAKAYKSYEDQYTREQK